MPLGIMDVKVGSLLKEIKNPQGILYWPDLQKESGSALCASTLSMLFGILAIVQSRLHLLVAW